MRATAPTSKPSPSPTGRVRIHKTLPACERLPGGTARFVDPDGDRSTQAASGGGGAGRSQDENRFGEAATRAAHAASDEEEEEEEEPAGWRSGEGGAGKDEARVRRRAEGADRPVAGGDGSAGGEAEGSAWGSA